MFDKLVSFFISGIFPFDTKVLIVLSIIRLKLVIIRYGKPSPYDTKVFRLLYYTIIRWTKQVLWEINSPTGLTADTNDIDRYLWGCIKYKRCCLCGRDGETHHWDAIGMGNDRTTLDDRFKKEDTIM